MTRDEIIRMAREAHGPITGQWWDMDVAALERFYHLARAAGEQAERDRTKRLVEDMQDELRQRRMTARDT